MQNVLQFIKSEDACHVTVLHYENLRKENFLGFTLLHPVAAKFLPDERDFYKFTMQKMINVNDSLIIVQLYYSIDANTVINYVKDNVKMRKQTFVAKKNLVIMIIAEAMEALERTNLLDSKYADYAKLLVKNQDC